MERQKVDNPFSMGPAVNRPKYQPDLQSSVAPRASFDKGLSPGTYIADALVKFAGVAGDAYIAKTAKKVKLDKVVQTSRAVQGMIPTTDATVAGERSHALVAANTLSMKAAYRLDDFAKSNPTDEDWEKEIRREGESLDASMLDKYDNYNSDIEMQEATILSFREKIPAVSMKREGYKIGFKEEKRIDTLTDSTILDLKAISGEMLGEGGVLLSASDKVNAIMPGVLGKLKGSELTESQKDTTISGAILRSGTLEGIELSKQYKGSRSTSLYERTASLQAMDKKIQADIVKQDKYASIELRRGVEKAYLAGEILLEDLIAYARKDDAMTPAKVESIMDNKDKADAVLYRARKLIETTSNPGEHSAPNTTAPEYQAALNTAFETSMEIDSIGIDQLPIAEQENAKADIRAKNIRQTSNNAVAEGIVYEPIVDSLKMVASADIAMMNKSDVDLTKLTIEDAPPEIKQAFIDFESMSPSSQQAHLSKLSSFEAEVWRTSVDAIKGGVPHLQALQNAQRTAKIPKAYKTKEVQKGVKKVIDEIDGFLGLGMDNSQEQYINEMVRAEVSRADDPTSSNHTERVADSFKSQYTNVDGIYYKGTSGALKKATGLHTDKLTSSFDIIKNTEQIKEKISAASKVFKFKPKEVFATIDPVLSTFQLRSPDGSWLSPTYPLDEIPNMQRVQKVEAEKKLTEDPGFFNKYWSRGKEVLKQSIHPTLPEKHWKDRSQF